MKNIREFWNGPGGDKWVASQAMMDATLAPFGEVLIEAARLPESGVVVDVGCGCGATSLMAARGRPQLRVIGVDVSTVMLERARSRAREEGLPIRFEVADAAVAEPIEGADRVISRFGVMFFDEPERAFENMRRWLGPDGELVVLVWGPVADNPWTSEVVELLQRHLDVPMPSEEAAGPFGLADPERFARILRGAGFAEPQQQPLDMPMRVPGSLDEVMRYHLERSLFVSALEEADEATARAVRQEVRAFVEARHDGRVMEMGAQARLVRARVAG